MKTYVIGDVHGCETELDLLLTKIFSYAEDSSIRIYFVGDLVDKGPDSLLVLKWPKALMP